MKKILLFTVLLLSLFANAQIINIPDANFKAKLLAASPTNGIALDANYNQIKIDINNDSEIQINEALQVYYLNIHNSNINNLEGIRSFTNIINLVCEGNSLTSLDLSGLANLYFLNCSLNLALSTINLNGLTNIDGIDCGYCSLSTLDLSGLTSLVSLNCNSNDLLTLNLNGLINLQGLSCRNNQLTSLNRR